MNVIAIKKRTRKPANYRKMLEVDSNAKTSKGRKLGYLTGIMYLAPADSSGVMNVCINASPECKDDCLFTSGLASVHPSINEARIRKTVFLHAHYDDAIASIAWDIEGLVNKANKLEPVERRRSPWSGGVVQP